MPNPSPEAANPKLPTDITQLHQLIGAEEALINRLDVNHLGSVTTDQLLAATGDKHLSAAEQRTAEIMLRTQDDLRYQRLGYFPHITGYADAAAPAPDLDRPFVKAHEAGNAMGELRKTIKVTDLELFDASVTRLDTARDMQSRGPDQISKFIMHQYATGEKGTKLTQADVGKAIGELTEKEKDHKLSQFEKEELDVLNVTRLQMNDMAPGVEPADHKSAAHAYWESQNKQIPASESQLAYNVDQMISQYENNPAVEGTLAAVRSGPRRAMNVGVEQSQPAPPPAAATSQAGPTAGDRP